MSGIASTFHPEEEQHAQSKSPAWRIGSCVAASAEPWELVTAELQPSASSGNEHGRSAEGDAESGFQPDQRAPPKQQQLQHWALRSHARCPQHSAGHSRPGQPELDVDLTHHSAYCLAALYEPADRG